MSRILLLVIAVLIFVWLLRRALTGRRTGGQARAPNPPPPAPELVACSHCGVLLPRNEAIDGTDPGAAAVRYFCSEDHRRRGAV